MDEREFYFLDVIYSEGCKGILIVVKLNLTLFTSW